ncbi:hypothetical protein D3C81_1590740 [compost metagenome]
MHLALPQATLGLHRDHQRRALACGQGNVLHRVGRQAQLPFGADFNVQLLGTAGQVGQVQRQAGAVASGKEARGRELGNQRRGNHGLAFGHAEVLFGPGLGHQPQFAVEVRDVDRGLALALVVQGYRQALLGDDGHRGVGALATLGHGRVTAERQAGQAALAGFDQLAVDVQLVGTVGLAPEQAGERVGGFEIGDVEDAHIHRR